MGRHGHGDGHGHSDGDGHSRRHPGGRERGCVGGHCRPCDRCEAPGVERPCRSRFLLLLEGDA